MVVVKELTVFIVDLSPSMANVTGERSNSDLDHGLEYFYDIASTKLMRGRATDYISVVSCHSPITSNLYSSDGKYQNIEVIKHMEPPTYSSMKMYHEKLKANTTKIEDHESDLFLAVILGLSLFKQEEKKKLKKNLVLITNGETEMKAFNKESAKVVANSFVSLGINVIINGIDFDANEYNFPNKSNIKRENEFKWFEFISYFAEKEAKIFSSTQAIEMIETSPPIKRVEPMSAFKGVLKFGADHSNNDSGISDSSLGLCFNVEAYPMIKTEPFPTTHQYFIDPESHEPVKVSRDSASYIVQNKTRKHDNEGYEDKISDNDDDNENDVNNENDQEDRITSQTQVFDSGSAEDDDIYTSKQRVDKGDYVNGFKYSNYDLIATPQHLISLSTLQCEPTMDIIGFLEYKNLPLAYLTGESFYVVPMNSSSPENVLGIKALSKTLLDLDSVAIIRFVKAKNKECQNCVLLPVKIKLNEKFAYSFSLIRIPYKEDEKIGRFPYLTNNPSSIDKESKLKVEEETFKEDSEKNEDKTHARKGMSLPSDKANSLMESFILSKDLDKNQEPSDKKVINNFKAVMTSTDVTQLPLPKSYHVKSSIESKLNATSLAHHKMTLYLKRAISKSLQHDDLYEFLTNPKFVQNELVKNDDFNNLFTLSNILSINSVDSSDWLRDLNEASRSYERELIKEFNIEYVDKEEHNKSKKKRKFNNTDDLSNLVNKKGNFGANEGDYGEVPDF